MKPKAETNTSYTTSSSALPGFESVNVEGLCEKTLTCEDLESRKNQLWLIKVPYEFDVSKLSGTTIVLNGTQELSAKLDAQNSGKRYESRASKYEKDETCHFKIAVPSKTKNCLNVAKDFFGHMDIIQTVKVPMLIYPPTPPPMYTHIPLGLKPRWKPFGHRTPPKMNKHKEVKKEKNAKVGVKRKRENGMKTEKHESSKNQKTKNECGYASSLQIDDSNSYPKKKKQKRTS